MGIGRVALLLAAFEWVNFDIQMEEALLEKAKAESDLGSPQEASAHASKWNVASSICWGAPGAKLSTFVLKSMSGASPDVDPKNGPELAKNLVEAFKCESASWSSAKLGASSTAQALSLAQGASKWADQIGDLNLSSAVESFKGAAVAHSKISRKELPMAMFRELRIVHLERLIFCERASKESNPLFAGGQEPALSVQASVGSCPAKPDLVAMWRRWGSKSGFDGLSARADALAAELRDDASNPWLAGGKPFAGLSPAKPDLNAPTVGGAVPMTPERGYTGAPPTAEEYKIPASGLSSDVIESSQGFIASIPVPNADERLAFLEWANRQANPFGQGTLGDAGKARGEDQYSKEALAGADDAIKLYNQRIANNPNVVKPWSIEGQAVQADIEARVAAREADSAAACGPSGCVTVVGGGQASKPAASSAPVAGAPVGSFCSGWGTTITFDSKGTQADTGQSCK